MVANQAIPVYSAPSTRAEVITQLDTHKRLAITSEAECTEHGIWWRVRFEEAPQSSVNRGYVLEFDQGDPQIASLIQHLNVMDGSAVITANNLQQLQPVISAEYEWPTDLVWSPDSEYLAVSTPWSVWVHRVTEPGRDPIQIMPTALDVFDGFGSVMFGRDSSRVAVVSTSGSLHLVSLTDQTKQLIAVKPVAYTGVAAISHDLGKWATANVDGDIALWDAQSGQQIHVLEGHTRVGDLAFTPDGSILVSNGGGSYSGLEQVDPTVRLWKVETGEQLAVFEVNSSQLMTFRPASDTFISANGEIAGILDFREADNEELAWFVHLIDIPNRSIRTTIPVSGEDGPRGLAFSSTGNVLAVNFSTSIVLLDPDSGTPLLAVPFDRLVHASAFSPDGTWLAIGHETGEYVGASEVEIWAVP